MKKRTKVLIAIAIPILLIPLVIAVYFGYALFGVDVKETDDISYYRALSGEIDGASVIPVFISEFDMPCPYDLPLLSELQPYSDIQFNYTAKRSSIFEAHAYVLVVSYEEGVYAEKKSSLSKTFAPYEGKIPGETEAVSANFELDGFEFYAAAGGEYPNSMLLIGTYDEGRKIAFVYFYDQDLDYIDPSLKVFLIEETGWKKVVQ